MFSVHINICKAHCDVVKLDMIPSGCVNAVTCFFSFDESWEGYIKTASFESAYGTYHALIEDGKCLMPNEIVAHASSVKIGVIGVKDSVTVVTAPVSFSIATGADKDAKADPDYQPTLLEQMLSVMQQTKEITESIRADADAGKFDGKAGVSCKHAWNGYTLTVTSASGTSSADLKGPPGDKGYTPVRGTDYWTDADIAEIKSYVDEAILGGAW